MKKNNLKGLSFSLLGVMLLYGCDSNKTKIQEICQTYIDARLGLNEGDSVLLKDVTSDSMYQMVMLNHYHGELIKEHSPDVVMVGSQKELGYLIPGEVEINQDKAKCRMNNTILYYSINLKNVDDKWIIIGENDKLPQAETFNSVKKKMTVLRSQILEKPFRDSVLNELTNFFSSVESYFNGSSKSFTNEYCDRATARLIRNLHSYVDKRNHNSLLEQEMEKPKYVTFEVKGADGVAKCKYYNDSLYINFTKIDGMYRVTGFNGVDSKVISIRTGYATLLRTLRLIDINAHKNDVFM